MNVKAPAISPTKITLSNVSSKTFPLDTVHFLPLFCPHFFLQSTSFTIGISPIHPSEKLIVVLVGKVWFSLSITCSPARHNHTQCAQPEDTHSASAERMVGILARILAPTTSSPCTVQHCRAARHSVRTKASQTFAGCLYSEPLRGCVDSAFRTSAGRCSAVRVSVRFRCPS